MVQDTSQQETRIVKGSNISKLRSGRWVKGVLSSTVLVTLLTPGGIIHNITTAFLNRLPPIEVLNPGSLGNFRVTQTIFQDEDCIQPSKFANFNSPSKELTVDSALCSLSNRVALFIKGPRFPNGTYQFVPIKSAQTNAFVDFWVQKAVAEAAPAHSSIAAITQAQTMYASTVICQKQLDGGLLRRRIKNNDGSCTDETIDLLTGNVTKREKAASCTSDCS